MGGYHSWNVNFNRYVKYDKSGNFVVDKSQFIMSLFEQLDKKHHITTFDQSIIDRCVSQVYRDSFKDNSTPTLVNAYKKTLISGTFLC